jgi:hypothetical protein
MYWKVRLRYVWMPQYLDVFGVAVALSDMWSHGHLQTPFHYQTHSNIAQIWHPCKYMDALSNTSPIKMKLVNYTW